MKTREEMIKTSKGNFYSAYARHEDGYRKLHFKGWNYTESFTEIWNSIKEFVKENKKDASKWTLSFIRYIKWNDNDYEEARDSFNFSSII